MRLALITPHYFPSVRGNSITVQRIESGLRDQGLSAQVFSMDRQEAGAIRQELARLRPTIAHGFHARTTGPLVAAAAAELRIPWVVTLTGTDVNHDLFDPEWRAAVLEVLREADALVAFHASIKARVEAELPGVGPRVHVIGQAVQCQEARFDLGERLGIRPPAFVAFQPAGIRQVKNIASVLGPLAALQERHPHLRYLLAGPVIEADEGQRVQALLRERPWAAYLGALAHEEICAILPQVQVVINSSLSEGGMSNAVLEAMSKGVPVLASDIDGNRSVIQDGQDGLLYASLDEFAAKLTRLLQEPTLGPALGRRAQAKIAGRFRLEGEIGAYLALYKSLLPARV
jgi:glycosyltransferase involved in cell wall biosynthesis